MSKNNHPARYNEKLLPVFAKYLNQGECVLDPFAGTGERLLKLAGMTNTMCVGIELDPTAWNNVEHGIILQGDATDLPWADSVFDAVVTSPVYGNRMSDSFEIGANNKAHYNTYTHRAKVELSPNNAGTLYAWQDAYWLLHAKAWREVERVLVPGGKFILNTKDFYRNGELILVTETHIELIEDLNFRLIAQETVELSGLTMGANPKRTQREDVTVFECEK